MLPGMDFYLQGKSCFARLARDQLVCCVENRLGKAVFLSLQGPFCDGGIIYSCRGKWLLHT